MLITEGSQFLARGPLRLTVTNGSISCRGIAFDPASQPLVVKVWESFDLTALEDSQLQTAGMGQLEPVEAAYPSEWPAFIGSLPADFLGKALIAGQSDTGKSTLCTLLANRCLITAREVSLVDSDVGQSSIGPPTAVGLGRAKKPLLRLTEAEFVDAYFAGDTSPAHCIEEVVEGTRVMMEEAEAMSETTILDTCGLVTGPLGEYLTKQIIATVQPDVIVMLEREDELAYLQSAGTKVIRLPALPTGKKGVEARRAFRLSQYLSCLKQSRIVRYDLSAVAVEGYLARRARRRSLAQNGNPLKSANLNCSDLMDMHHAIVGLHKGEKYVDLGVIDSLDCDEKAIRILTTCASEIDRVIVGNLRLGGEGETRLLQTQEEPSRSGPVHQGP